MLLTHDAYEDLFIFYYGCGYDITVLTVDNKVNSSPLIIAKILYEHIPLEVDKLCELITLGPLKDFFDKSLYQPDQFYKGYQIYNGLISNIDINAYWDTTKYSADQMLQVRLGLEHHVDVAYYNNPLAFSSKEMTIIRLALESAQTKYANSF